MSFLLLGACFLACTNRKQDNVKKADVEKAGEIESKNSGENGGSPSETFSGEEASQQPSMETVWFGEDSVPFENATLIKRQTEFSDFATPLAIGDKIGIIEDCDVYRTSNDGGFGKSCGKLKKGSTVYYLYSGKDRDWICFVDEHGMSGWIKPSIPFRQRKYTADDSIIRKLWQKDGFDLARFSPDGKTVAFHRWDYRYSSSQGISVCDRVSGEELFVSEAKPYSRIACAFSPDGEYFYYVKDDKFLMQLSIKDRTQKNLGSPTPHQAAINDGSEFLQSIHPLPDGEHVLCGVYYEPWAMCNVKTGEWIYKKGGDFMWANSFAFSPDGKYIAGCAGNPTDICVWDMNTREIIWQKYRDFGGDLYYSDDGKTLYVVNGSGIASIDSKNGEVKSKTNIEFPYKYRINDWEVVPKKDRVLYAITEENQGEYDSVHGLSYLYVYELSTGRLVQAEHIEDEGKKIEDLELSPDGKYISIRVKDGTHVNECHQIICAVNLNKKARTIPAVKRDEEERKNRDFLLSTSFNAGWWELSFYPDGTYGLWARHDGTQTGNWFIEKGRKGYEVTFSTPEFGGKKEPYSFTNKYDLQVEFPGTYPVCPDYEDFESEGSIGAFDDGAPVLQSNRPSPAWKKYYYMGEDVIKYPGWGAKDIKYLHLLENTKMRESASVNSDTVSMPYYNGDEYIKDRSVVFAGQKIHIIAATERKETIGEKTAPWYLIYEDDHTYGEYSEGRLVWVFGGYSVEIGDSSGK